MSNLDSPIPLSEIESVLAWVDTFTLSRQTKKINRDFSDAVLLAEILAVHYPKLVEMHNYPPRNSHSLKLNNWLTLNRKVLKKLKLNLCCNTMEQLANCNAGVIERVLVMVRDKIRRDEDLNKSMKDAEQAMSSGGSYYEACGDEENVLVVPVKARVHGILETVHQKVVNYESYQALKEELKDARDAADVLKQKVEHLDNLLDLKEQRIEELQKQLDRKQARRKEAEAFQNSLQVPFETVPSPTIPILIDNTPTVDLVVKAPIPKPVEVKISKEDTKIPVKQDSTIKLNVISKPSITEVTPKDTEHYESINTNFNKPAKVYEENRNAFANVTETKPHITKIIVNYQQDYDLDVDVDRIRSDVFKEIEIIEERCPDYDEFEDSQQDNVTTIEQTIQNEIKHISKPMPLVSMDYRQERPIEYRQEMPMEFRQDLNSVI